MVATGEARGAGRPDQGRRGAAARRRASTTVVLDKTGTLTEGRPTVTDVIAAARTRTERGRAAALAAVGRARVRASAGRRDRARTRRSSGAAARRRVERLPVVTGQGVGGDASTGTTCVVGNERAAGGLQRVDVGAARRPTPSGWRREGETPVFVAVDGGSPGSLARRRSRSSRRRRAACARLQALGLDVVLLTGDNRRPREAVAREAGIDRVVADVLPEGKVAEVAAAAGGGARRRDGRRRHQRRAGARAGRRRHRDRHRHRHRDRGRRRHADARRPAAAWPRPSRCRARTMRDDAAEPVLGVRLQRRRHPDRGGRALSRRSACCSARSSPARRWRSVRSASSANSLRLRRVSLGAPAFVASS